MFNGNNLPHELLLTTRQTTKLRNAIESNISNDIMKIVQVLEDSGLLLKGITKTIKNETKEQKGGFLSMLLGTLGESLLGNLFTGKGTKRSGEGFLKAGEGI